MVTEALNPAVFGWFSNCRQIWSWYFSESPTHIFRNIWICSTSGVANPRLPLCPFLRGSCEAAWKWAKSQSCMKSYRSLCFFFMSMRTFLEFSTVFSQNLHAHWDENSSKFSGRIITFWENNLCQIRSQNGREKNAQQNENMKMNTRHF